MMYVVSLLLHLEIDAANICIFLDVMMEAAEMVTGSIRNFIKGIEKNSKCLFYHTYC